MNDEIDVGLPFFELRGYGPPAMALREKEVNAAKQHQLIHEQQGGASQPTNETKKRSQ